MNSGFLSSRILLYTHIREIEAHLEFNGEPAGLVIPRRIPNLVPLVLKLDFFVRQQETYGLSQLEKVVE